MGSHSVTCHPAAVTFLPLPQPKMVLDLVTLEGCKAELPRCATVIQTEQDIGGCRCQQVRRQE